MHNLDVATHAKESVYNIRLLQRIYDLCTYLAQRFIDEQLTPFAKAHRSTNLRKLFCRLNIS